MTDEADPSEINFANFPRSITETNSPFAEDWKPRDALISLLREIDRGETEVASLIVVYMQPDGTHVHRTASPRSITDHLGMLQSAMMRIWEQKTFR